MRAELVRNSRALRRRLRNRYNRRRRPVDRAHSRNQRLYMYMYRRVVLAPDPLPDPHLPGRRRRHAESGLHPPLGNPAGPFVAPDEDGSRHRRSSVVPAAESEAATALDVVAPRRREQRLARGLRGAVGLVVRPALAERVLRHGDCG